jgi:hypothetical protein
MLSARRCASAMTSNSYEQALLTRQLESHVSSATRGERILVGRFSTDCLMDELEVAVSGRRRLRGRRAAHEVLLTGLSTSPPIQADYITTRTHRCPRHPSDLELDDLRALRARLPTRAGSGRRGGAERLHDAARLAGLDVRALARALRPRRPRAACAAARAGRPRLRPARRPRPRPCPCPSRRTRSPLPRLRRASASRARAGGKGVNNAPRARRAQSRARWLVSPQSLQHPPRG